MPTAKHLLAIYRRRRDMQREGVTDPAPSVKAFCEDLVTRLETLEPETPVDVIERPTGERDFVPDGIVLATLPSDDAIRRGQSE